MAVADEALRAVLSIFPADPFLWLKLYSTGKTRHGFGPDSIKYLAQSYRVAPLDGWVALRRNKVGLSIFQMLAEDTRKAVVSEFVGLVDSGFTDTAALNLETVGWTERERLLASLVGVNIISRQAFAKRLALDGVKASIPGVEIDERPWP
ncbi:MULTISPECIES: hypothetical protein [unclassified Bradyrhizobium]|uniref:hypothetical protein n=1 Tax=unclassified Bradyrhizobium TaxID=2631580 RepID=UPI001CD3ED48|nr:MULTISPECIES: hypothetical protein [unclassified Bradyrhizobium]MCA1495223.1 hypothetical protein [Bradyrhizobium sp. NBAIM14]MCA1531031.1 hypothetical protein [Bradyrhizobium sp. NBAIM03]